MSWLNSLFGGNQEKSTDQLRYDELAADVYPWQDEDYNPNDPRNAEMERKQDEMTELHYRIYPKDRVTLPDDIEVVITSATIDELGEAVQEKKRGWF